jgi:metal-sulfur cluster biosynthetic enzyme
MNEPIGPDDVWRTLATVSDPEFGLNFVDLGLVYDVAVREGRDVQVRMTLTSPACPAGETIHGGAYAALAALPGVGKVEIDLVWEPPWTPAMLTAESRAHLGSVD